MLQIYIMRTKQMADEQEDNEQEDNEQDDDQNKTKSPQKLFHELLWFWKETRDIKFVDGTLNLKK